MARSYKPITKEIVKQRTPDGSSEQNRYRPMPTDQPSPPTNQFIVIALFTCSKFSICPDYNSLMIYDSFHLVFTLFQRRRPLKKKHVATDRLPCRRHPALHDRRLPGNAGDPRPAVPGLCAKAHPVLRLHWPLRQLHSGLGQQDLADGAILHVLPGVGRTWSFRFPFLSQGEERREEIQKSMESRLCVVTLSRWLMVFVSAAGCICCLVGHRNIAMLRVVT